MSSEALLLADEGMHRVVALLRSDVDPELKVSEDWTVRDVATHLVTGLEFCRPMAAGEPSPLAEVADVAANNASMIAEALPEPDLRVIADRVEKAWAALREAVVSQPADAMVTWHAGERLPMSALVGMMIGESEVHGYDVARAAGIPWLISAETAAITLGCLAPALPLFLDTEAVGDFAGRFELRVRTRPERAYLAIADHELTVEAEPGGRVDCHISARGHELMLALYGRIGPITPALQGRMVAYGRRPWWGLRLPGFFRAP
jgi:uncharacterized protein (TIGR03083 family)